MTARAGLTTVSNADVVHAVVTKARSSAMPTVFTTERQDDVRDTRDVVSATGLERNGPLLYVGVQDPNQLGGHIPRT